MNHNDIRHKLSEYIDNALNAEERTEVEAHLKSCQKCSNALEELRKAVEQVRQAEEIEPPTWMTQKIMAKVRAEAEMKQSWYQRLFFPLASKLPIQAVAVLFLAVTAYYVYQNTNPAERYKEAPPATFESAKQEAPALAPAPEPKIQGEPAPRAKNVPQSPQYKALDMKQEYEKPAPPAPVGAAGAPAPAASAPTAEMKKEAPSEKRAFAPRAAAPSAMQDKAEPSMGFVAKEEKPAEPSMQRKMKPAAPAKAMLAESSGEVKRIRLSLVVADLAGADKKLEGIIKELKGTIVARETGADTQTISVFLDAKMQAALREKLGKLGELKEKGTAWPGYAGILQVEIILRRP